MLELKGLMALPSPPIDGKINEKEYEKMNMLSDQLKNYYSPANELSLGTYKTLSWALSTDQPWLELENQYLVNDE